MNKLRPAEPAPMLTPLHRGQNPIRPEQPAPLWTSCLTSPGHWSGRHADLRRPVEGPGKPIYAATRTILGLWNPASAPLFREAPKDPIHREPRAPAIAPPPPSPQEPMHREEAAARPAGPLRNGNPRGNPNLAPRCGARTRLGCPCRGPAMQNGRCRMHGGAATGPKTAEGRARIAAARRSHGRYSAATRASVALTATITARTHVLRALVETGQPIEALAPLMRHIPINTPYDVSGLALMQHPLTVREGRALAERIRATPPSARAVTSRRGSSARRRPPACTS